MNSQNKQKKREGFWGLFKPKATRTDAIIKFQAFLDGAPSEYFAFDENGLTLYSPGFSRLFGIDDFKSLEDIQDIVTPSDWAALTHMRDRYERQRRPLEVVVTNDRNRSIRLMMRWGDIDGYIMDIIWAEDITHMLAHEKQLKHMAETAERDLMSIQKGLDALVHPVWLRNEEGSLTWCNEAYANLLDTERSRAIENNLSPIFKDIKTKKRIDEQALSREALRHNQGQLIETYAVIKGVRKKLILEERPVSQLNSTIGTISDLTQLEELEQNRGRLIESYHTLLQELQTAISLFDENQKLIFFNTAFSRLWQLDESWLNQKPKLGDILEKLRDTRRLPEQADFKSYKKEWLDRFTKLIAAHNEMIVLPDGTMLRTLSLPDPSGGLMLIFEDVTSNIELEASYNTLMAVQNETLDNLSEGVLVCGPDGRIKLWNPSFVTLWKLNPEDLDGQPHISKIADKTKRFFDEDTWKERFDMLSEHLQNRKEGTSLIKRKDDKSIEFSAVPLPDGGSLFTYTDVTDSTNLEEALTQKNLALETAEKLKTEFLTRVSYQLRTPLNAIIGFNEILENEYFGKLTDKQREYTSGISEAGDKLKFLIDDILDLTSIEAGVLELKKEEFEIIAFSQTIESMGKDWADSKQIKLTVSCPKNIGKLHADRKRLWQVLMHLTRNAIEYTPEKGVIDLKFSKQKDTLSISLSDNGTGISTQDKARIFKPFEKSEANSTDRPTHSIGLGLSLVQKIIELHDGHITIEDQKPQGTTFKIKIPLKGKT